MIHWLGYKPEKITYSSDYFEDLFYMAIKLIKMDLAYVCHQNQRKNLNAKERANVCDSPTRNQSIKNNLKEFWKMQNGDYETTDAVLRLKFRSIEGFIDPVAYRICPKPHCRTGTRWKVYPTYDFAHCICDSLENISISLCSKEFANHRRVYEWVLKQLELPMVE